MYNWFNKHLKLGQPEPVVEKPFVPVPPKELSVYDEQHPRPKDAVDAERPAQVPDARQSDKQLAALSRRTPAEPGGVPPRRRHGPAGHDQRPAAAGRTRSRSRTSATRTSRTA